MKTLIGALALCALMAGQAQAEVKDRVVPADVSPQILYQQIVVAATSICEEGVSAGEVYNVNKCVEIVVEKTVAEVNRPSLTLYARTTTPAEAARRDA